MKHFIPLAVALAAPAFAEEPRALTVVNDTGTPVNQIFVRRAGAGERSGVVGALGDLVSPRGDREDRLGSASLRARGEIALPLTGIRGCKVDLKAVMEDGRTFAAPGFDVCASSRWTIGN